MVACLRAALDIGSGAAKLTVALVDNDELSILHSEEIDIHLGHAVNQVPGRDWIPDSAVDCLLLAVSRFDTTIRKFEHSLGLVAQRAAAATATFRETRNGAATLDRLTKTVHLHKAAILSQQEEGEVGFLTGCALLRHQYAEVDNIVVWDSGASSFQLSTGTRFPAPVLRGVHGGLWGSSKAVRAMLVHILGQTDINVSPNPVSPTDAEKLRAFITADLKQHFGEAAIGELNKNLNAGSVLVSGIGGTTSAHRMSWIAAGRADDGSVERTAVWNATVSDICGRTDAELAARGYPQVELLVSKLCLITAVMDVFGMTKFLYRFASGSTLGMLLFPPLWASAAAASPSKL